MENTKQVCSVCRTYQTKFAVGYNPESKPANKWQIIDGKQYCERCADLLNSEAQYNGKILRPKLYVAGERSSIWFVDDSDPENPAMFAPNRVTIKKRN